MENPFLKLSASERAKQLDLLKAAMESDQAASDIVAATALKWAIDRLGSRDKLSDAWTSIPQQAYPREKLLARFGDLSETQIHNLAEATRKALDGIRL